MEQKVKRQVGCLSWNKVCEGDDETGEGMFWGGDYETRTFCRVVPHVSTDQGTEDKPLPCVCARNSKSSFLLCRTDLL